MQHRWDDGMDTVGGLISWIAKDVVDRHNGWGGKDTIEHLAQLSRFSLKLVRVLLNSKVTILCSGKKMGQVTMGNGIWHTDQICLCYHCAVARNCAVARK